MSQIAEIRPQTQPALNTQAALIPRDVDQALRLAELMAGSRVVPQHLQGCPGECFQVVEQAMRWGMSPFAVAQCTSFIHGKQMYEGKLVAAAVNKFLAKRLDYSFRGDGADLTVTVTGTIRGEKTPRVLDVRLGNVSTKNDVWKKQPQQQLSYSGARVGARRYMPEVMLGVYCPEEDFSPSEVDVTPEESPADVPRQNALPDYPQDQFDMNIDAWGEAIQAGKITADKVIAKVETKGVLTEAMKTKIRDFEITDAEVHDQ